MDDKLEQLLILKLDFIRKIQSLFQDSNSEEEQEILELIKQYSQYDFATKILRKLHRKYSKNWF